MQSEFWDVEGLKEANRTPDLKEKNNFTCHRSETLMSQIETNHTLKANENKNWTRSGQIDISGPLSIP